MVPQNKWLLNRRFWLPPEILFCTLITGNWNLNSFSSDFWYVQSPSVQTSPNHVSLSQNQNPWFYRTSWNCGGELFGSVTVNIRFKIKTDIFSIFTISVNFWNHRNLSVCFDFYPFFNVRLKNWLIRFYFLVRDFWLNLEEEFVKSISSLPNDSEKTDKSW